MKKTPGKTLASVVGLALSALAASGDQAAASPPKTLNAVAAVAAAAAVPGLPSPALMFDQPATTLNPFRTMVEAILECQYKDLSARKKKSEDLKSAVASLNDFLTGQKAAGASKDLIAKLEAEIEAKKNEAKAPDAAFSAEDVAALVKLEVLKTYVTSYFDARGRPESYYSVQAGLEGGLDTDDSVKLTSTKFVAALFFASPLLSMRVPNGVPRLLAAPASLLKVPDDGPPELKKEAERPQEPPRRLFSSSFYPTFPNTGQLRLEDGKWICPGSTGECISLAELLYREKGRLQEVEEKAKKETKESQGKVARDTTALQAASKALETAKAELQKSETDLLKKDSNARTLEPLEKALEVVRQAESVFDTAKDNLSKAEEDLKAHKKAESEAGNSFCRACAAVEGVIAKLDDLDAMEVRRDGPLWWGNRDPADPPRLLRIGPFLIPSAIKRQTAPVWAFTRLRNEILPDFTTDTASEVSRVTASFGLYYSWNLSDSLVVGPFGAVGGVIGSLPGSDNAFRRHFFYEAGGLLQTKYRVAETDKAKGITGVFGQLFVGYKRENYFVGQAANPQLAKEADRLTADLKLSYGPLTTATVRPMIYLTLDKSASGVVHRDRAGVLLDIDLDTLFKAPVTAATEGSKTSTPTTASTAGSAN